MSGVWWEYVVIGLFTFILGWIAGVLMMRKSYESKYNPKIKGTLRLAYDVDDPERPAMGLMIESMEYLLTNETVLLAIEKKNFPEDA
jgi:hypothetical protein